MGQLIELRRDPFQVLGVDRDISSTELEAHVEQLRRENDPARLEGMSADLRAHAERRLSEVEAAYSQITTRADPTDR
jgi:preprotein translocase subunit Sec63